VLIIAALGWMFDCLDQNLFNLVRQVSVLELLEPHYSDPAALQKAAARIGPLITACFLIGWAVGGFVFGILGDRLAVRGR
jgi:MFS family permease